MNTRTLAALAATIVGALLGLAPAAQAVPDGTDDTKPCVSWLEFDYAGRGTMHDEEVAWEVRGLGHVVQRGRHGNHVVKQYPRCGFSETGKRGMRTGWVQVSYDRNKDGQFMANYMLLWSVGRDAARHVS